MATETTLAVFGANGKVGREFVEMALESGYFLRAFVRNRRSFAFADTPGVDLIEGDATSADDVAEFVDGASVVTSFLGNPGKDTYIMFAATNNILTAAAAQPIAPRCLMISSVGMGGSSWLIKGMLTLIVGRTGIKDYERAEERVRNDSSVPFVVIRPYALNDKLGKGTCKVIPGRTAHFAKPIPRADVARFFFDCVEDTRWDGSYVNIGGA